MPIDVANLRSLAPGISRFLEFEREVEESIRQEEEYRLQEIVEEKRQREKRARKKRIRRLRQTQHD